jgi:hypothetical protein
MATRATLESRLAELARDGLSNATEATRMLGEAASAPH